MYIAIDIGGTAIKYGLVDENGVLTERNEIATEAQLGGASIRDKVLGIVEHYVARQEIKGVGISSAGMVDCETGRIIFANPLIPAYTGINHKEAVEARFHIPCEVENDVNCAGLAEGVAGAAKGTHSAVVMTVGTGIGGCLIADGRVYHGFSHSAFEVGYMHIDKGERFERQGAASAMVERVAEAKSEPVSEWNGKRVFSQAQAGDAICQEAIDNMVDVLARGIANVCYIINPEVVLLGGGIMAQQEYLAPRLNEALDRYLVESVRKHTRLAFAALGNDAGMLGAYYNFRARH